jgi:hypothetical protein
MYNKKALKVDLGKYKKPNPYKGDIEVNSNGQWDGKGVYRIPGPDITMDNVDFPVWAQPNVGPGIAMQPDQNYHFKGADYVDEYPMAAYGGDISIPDLTDYEDGGEYDLTQDQIDELKKGGYIVHELPNLPKKKDSKKYSRSLTATNKLFAQNPLTKKAKSKKNKIFDPQAKQFEKGGFHDDINKHRKLLRDWTYGQSIGMLQKAQKGKEQKYNEYNQNVRYEQIYEPLVDKITNSDVVMNNWEKYPNYNTGYLEYILNGPDKNRNIPPATPEIKEMQQKILSLPNSELDRLMKVNWEGAGIPTVLWNKPSNVSTKEMWKYYNHLKYLKDKGYTLEEGGLTKAQEGVFIQDPKKYAYRKKMYDDSLKLYNQNAIYQLRRNDELQALIDWSKNNKIYPKNTAGLVIDNKSKTIPVNWDTFKYEPLQNNLNKANQFNTVNKNIKPIHVGRTYVKDSKGNIALTDKQRTPLIVEYPIYKKPKHPMYNTSNWIPIEKPPVEKPISLAFIPPTITDLEFEPPIEPQAQWTNPDPWNDIESQKVYPKTYIPRQFQGAWSATGKATDLPDGSWEDSRQKYMRLNKEYQDSLRKGNVASTQQYGGLTKAQLGMNYKDTAKKVFNQQTDYPTNAELAQFLNPEYQKSVQLPEVTVKPSSAQKLLTDANKRAEIANKNKKYTYTDPVSNQKIEFDSEQDFRNNRNLLTGKTVINQGDEIVPALGSVLEFTGVPGGLRTLDRIKEDPIKLGKNIATTVYDLATLPQNLSNPNYLFRSGKFSLPIDMEALGVTADAAGLLPFVPKGTSRAIKQGVKMIGDDVLTGFNKLATGNSRLTDFGIPAWKIEKANTFTRSGLGGMDMSRYEIKNPDYFSQLLDSYTSKQLSPSNKKFYKGLIDSVKKQNGLVTERQYYELQRLKSGNFDFGKRGYGQPSAQQTVSISNPKSDVDWSKWNPDTPNYPELINEYNAIEEASKANGTWMKNPDGTPYVPSKEALEKGLGEHEFIMTQSKRFKEAYPEGYETMHRGYPRNDFEELAKEYPEGRSIFGGDRNIGMYYAGRNPERLHTVIHPKSKNSLEFSDASSWREIGVDPELGIQNMWEGEPGAFREGLYKDPVTGYYTKGQYVSTDDIASHLEKNKINYAKIKDLFDGVQSEYVTILNQRPGNYAKKLVGNLGFFDLKNPNTLKGLAPYLGAGYLGYKGLNSSLEQEDGGYIETELTPQQIEEYRDGGYIVDELD